MKNTAIKNLESRIKKLESTLPPFRFLSKNAQAFSEACIDINSIDELTNIRSVADRGDMETWDITASGWKLAIKHALLYHLKQLLESNESTKEE